MTQETSTTNNAAATFDGLAENDSLQEIIIRRLAARQEKLDRMAQLDRKATLASRRRPIRIALAVAASVAIIVAVLPRLQSHSSLVDELGIGKPTMEAFRAASPEIANIESLVEQDEIQEALRHTQKALKGSDLAIAEFEGAPELWEDNPEEAAYEEAAERLKNNELRWTYIYLLLKADNKKEAKRQVGMYLKTKDKAQLEHFEDAVALQKRLK